MVRIIDLEATPNLVPESGDYITRTLPNGAKVTTQYNEIVVPEDEQVSTAFEAFVIERDRLFGETTWARQRHQDRLDAGINDQENWSLWLAYWDSLRNMEEQDGFDPRNIKWPERPYKTVEEEAKSVWQRLLFWRS